MNQLQALEQAGTAPALHTDGSGWVDHAALAAMADAAVAALLPRSLLALQFRPTLAAVSVYLGALRNGHVPLLLDSQLDPGLQQRLLVHFGVKHVFDGQQWLPGPAAGPAPLLHPALALLMSTSGSTGSPKLVRLTLANLQANAESIVQYMALSPDDRAISSLPLHYSYGLSVLNSHLVAGAAVVLADDAVTSEAFWTCMRAHGVTSLSGVPTTWRMLRRLRFERMGLPALRRMTQAGGRMDRDDVQWLAGVAAATGRQLFVMYGQTEATARIAYLPPAQAAAKPDSIGTAIPGGRLHLRDEQGAVIDADGVEGELVYQGPNVMMGYAQQPTDLAEGPGPDLLPTGDLAVRDADGHYRISGRRSRFVKLFGNRFGLDEVEQQLREQGLEAAATGRDDCLMIGLVGSDAQAQALQRSLASQYRVHPSAIVVRTLPALPRNSAGKLLHAELLARLSEAATVP
ncbi:MAG: AMP-binding protein [Rubrivivax sp.]